MMPSFISSHNAFLCAGIFALVVLATDSVVLVAILKKKRVKASGWFQDFGFQIEADDQTSADQK
jgi:hypothetical protein